MCFSFRRGVLLRLRRRRGGWGFFVDRGLRGGREVLGQGKGWGGVEGEGGREGEGCFDFWFGR